MYQLFLVSEHFARSCHCVSSDTSCGSQDLYRDCFLNNINLNRIFEVLIAVLMNVPTFICFVLRAVIRSVIHITNNVHFKVYDVFYSPNSHQRVLAEFWNAFCWLFYIMNIHHFFFSEKSIVAYQSALCDVPEDSNFYYPKCCGIYGLFDDFVGGLRYRVSIGRIINRQWTGTDATGSGRGLIWRSNSAFSCSKLRTTTQLVVWAPEIPNKALVLESQRVYCNLGEWIHVQYNIYMNFRHPNMQCIETWTF
jgi:hypothetical protein